MLELVDSDAMGKGETYAATYRAPCPSRWACPSLVLLTARPSSPPPPPLACRYARLNAVFTATLNMWIVICFSSLAFCFTTVVLLSPISADNVQLW